MADDVPTPRKGVYLYCEFIALGFVLEGIVDVLHGGPWWRWSLSIFVAAPLFIWLGIKGPEIKSKLSAWLHAPKALATALAENADLKKQLALDDSSSVDITTTPEILRTAPRLLVRHIGAHPQRADLEGRLGYLEFASDKPTIIRKVGSVFSKERYESEHEFKLSLHTLPLVDNSKPVKCKILGVKQRPLHGTYFIDSRALLDVLDQKTTQSDDSVVIDYDDEDGHEFSRRFVLTHNQNEGISWIPDPVSLRGKTQSLSPGAQDLAILRHKLGLAAAFPREQQTAEECAKQLDEQIKEIKKLEERFAAVKALASQLRKAGSLELLAEDALYLSEQFRIILAENANDYDHPLDLSHPLTRSIVVLDLSEQGAVIPWQRRRLMSFREHYSTHKHYVKQLALPELKAETALASIPNDLEANNIQEMLLAHSIVLSDKAEQFIKAFEAA